VTIGVWPCHFVSYNENVVKLRSSSSMQLQKEPSPMSSLFFFRPRSVSFLVIFALLSGNGMKQSGIPYEAVQRRSQLEKGTCSSRLKCTRHCRKMVPGLVVSPSPF
jgi:hypothetical protein